MNPTPFYVPAVFIVASFVTVFIFYLACNRNVKLLMTVVGWMIMQAVVAATGFFTVENTLPPRFLVLIILPVIGMITIFSTAKGKSFIESFDVKRLTVLHSVRVAIEIVLFWLFLNKAVPQLMTFEGRNFDLISGLTAPLIYYFGFVKRKLGTRTILAWNFICLAILLFTVTNAVLSAPTPLQKFAFDQPTIAVFYFPFVWLPGVVVPIVIFSHLVTIRALMKGIKHRNVAPGHLLAKQIA